MPGYPGDGWVVKDPCRKKAAQPARGRSARRSSGAVVVGSSRSRSCRPTRARLPVARTALAPIDALRAAQAAPGRRPDEPPIAPVVEAAVPNEPVDPKRIVYSLFMHVGAVPLDGAQAKRVPWLGKAHLPGSKPSGSTSTIDAALLAKLQDRGPDGRAKVVSGLSIPVAGKDVLWVAGRGRVAKVDDSIVLESLVRLARAR